MSYNILGNCSLCGGRVAVPLIWYGVVPPEPTCLNCKAVKDGPVITMKKNTNEIEAYIGNQQLKERDK